MSADSPPPPSLFDKLPVELLKCIVDDVEQQDSAFRRSGMTKAKFAATQDEQERGLLGGRTQPLVGKWSPWHGSGVAALAAVSKQMRKLCMPALYKSLSLKQLAPPLFRYKLVQQIDPRLVQHLDIRRGEQRLYTLAGPTLHLLPAVKRLTVGRRSTPLVSVAEWRDPMAQEEASAAAEAFRLLARSATSVTACDLESEELGILLSRLDLPSLRSLEFLRSKPHDGQGFTLADDDHDMAQAFAQLTALETLSIHDSVALGPYEIADSWRGLSLSSLTSLTFTGGDDPSVIVDILPSLTPNLRHLRLTFLSQYFPNPPNMPSLLSFELDFPEIIGATGFTAPPSSAITSLSISARPSLDVDCKDNIPDPASFPPTLRSINLHLKSSHLPCDTDAVTAECAARGVAFRLLWTPDMYVLADNLSGDFYSLLDGDFDEQAIRAAYETLDWAKRRLDWVTSVGDTRSMHEIAESLYPLRERQMIDLQ